MYSHKDIKEAHQNVIYDDVPDNHNDFHVQMHVIVADLKYMQDLEEGICWQLTIDGETNPTFFPILYIIGDTMEHNELVPLKNGPTSELPC